MWKILSSKTSVIIHLIRFNVLGLSGLFLVFLWMSIPSSVFAANKIWSGATNTVWAVAANWVGNSAPGNADNVFIPGGLTNYPIATANVKIKSVTINSTGTGGRLTIAGGTFNSTPVIVNAGGFLFVSAGLLSPTGVTVSGTFNMSGGTVQSSGVILVNGGGLVNQTGGLIVLSGNSLVNPNDNLQLNSGGVYNQSNGTLLFKDFLPGGGTFNQTGVNALVKVNRNWLPGSGSVFNAASGTIQFTGNSIQSNFAAGTRQFSNVIVDAGVNPGFSQAASSVIQINGNFTNKNTALTNTTNATFVFNGSGNQTISSVTTGAVATLGNLQVNKSGGVLSLLSNCNVSGDITITNGTYDLSTFTSNRSVAGGALIVSATGIMRLGGTAGGQTGSNFPINFTTVGLAPTSTIHYNGANQTIVLLNYGNLILSGNAGAVVKSFPAAALPVAGNFTTLAGTSASVTCNAVAEISVAGNLTIGLNTVLNGSVHNHSVIGNLVNNGTYSSTGITNLGGNLSGSGIYNGVDATLAMNGVTLQILSGSVFAGDILKNLTINNSSGVLLTGNLKVTAIVNVVQGDFNTGGFLTLVSTSAQTALIDGSGSGSVSGLVTMQRYLPSGFGYKYFSSPFQAATVNEFSDDMDLLSAFPPFYRYDESSVATGWVNYSNPSGLLVPFSGYAANLGGSSAAVTVDISGEVNNTPQSVSLFNTNQLYTTGFNLAGNPYPSPINWDAAAGWNRVNIDDAVYYFDASSSDQYGGIYSSYINGISSNGSAGSLIPAMQGFFVHVTDGAYPVAGILGLNNAARTTDLQPLFHRTLQNDQRPMLRLEAGFSDVPATSDALVVYFDDAATPGFDKAGDALKIINTDSNTPSIYSIAVDQSKLSINAYPDSPEQSVVIPLGIRTDREGRMMFNCKAIDQIPDSIYVYLSDAESRINLDLRINSSYSVNLKQGVDDNRFSLVFTTDPLPYITDTDEFGVYSSGGTIYIYVHPEAGEKGTLEISNMQGQAVYRKQYNSEGYHTIESDFMDGIYVISFYTSGNSFSKKIFLRNE